MAHQHSDEGGSATFSRTGRLKLALALTFTYMIVEAVGGWWTNSLALIADAGHMLTDVAALSLTLGAIWFGARPATEKKTFGYFRLEILAALVNGVVLAVLSIWVIWQAILRSQDPPEIDGSHLTLIAVGGLIVNIIAAALLHSGHKHDLNMRGAWLHVMGDMLGSAMAIAAGLLIAVFGWYWADPATSVLISVIIIVGSWRLIVESVNVLLEGTPKHISISAVEKTMIETSGVMGVHDLHIWTISSGMEALSAHITHDGSTAHSDLLNNVRERLHNDFGIDHLTIQIETMNSDTEAVYVCELGGKCFELPSRREQAS